ncbi:MAG: ATP-binding protein, partial [Candidatus Binatia bacterium]
LGLGAARTRFDISRARGLSRFVGRGADMRTLEDAIEQTAAGNGQVVGVVADAGTGKSRLCFEFVERRRHENILVREAHAVSHGRMLPFLPVLEFLRGYFGITEQDSDDMARDKIAGRVVRLDPALTDALPLVFDFLGVPDSNRPAPALNPETRQRQLFGLFRRLVHARSTQQPAVLLWEDLHWMDAASEAYLENLVESVPGTRTLLLVNFRPEYQARWMQKSYYQQLPLLPLGPEAIDELLDHLLGPDPAVGELRHRLQTQSGGNPFFVEELVQSLVDAGALDGTRGAYRLVRPIEEVAIAPTVQAVLAARIDRLAERDKQVLQNAAVIGKTFSESILRRVVARLSEAQLADAVRALLAGEFLYEEALFPETEYTFKHPLTQEVAYGSQLVDTRRQVHAAVARAIEALEANKLDEHAALLAHHWEHAGEPLAAARAHRLAALWATGKDAVEARRHWRRIRELLGDVAEANEALELRVEACCQIMLYSGRMGGADEGIGELFAEAKDLAARSQAPGSTALVFILYGYSRLLAGRIAEAEVAFDQARGPLDDANDANLEAARRYGVATMYAFVRGECARALPLIDDALAFADRDPQLGAAVIGYPIAGALHAWRGMTLGLMGRLEEAASALERAITWGRESAPSVLVMVAAPFIYVAELLGESAGAMSRARQSVEIAAELGMWEHLGQLNLGMAHLLNEDWNDAARFLEQGLAMTRHSRAQLFQEPLFLTALARAHLGRGDAEAARALAEEAIALAPDRGVHTADAHLVRARALLQAGGEAAHDDIASVIADAERFVQSSGARSRQPTVHELRAELARRAGDEPARVRELREAARLFAEMGATRHAQRVGDQVATVKGRKKRT